MKSNLPPSLVDSPAVTPAVPATGGQHGDYAWWRSSAEKLLVPLAALMQPDRADLPLRGQASNHGEADRLESFARPCLLAAHWLASERGAAEKLSGAGWWLAPTLPVRNTGGRRPITTNTPSKWRR